MQARSYPFERLPRVPRAQLGWLRGVVRALPEGASERLSREAALLLGAPLHVRAHAPELVSSGDACRSLRDPCCALRLELAGDALARGLLLELAPDGAAALCDRLLGGDGSLATTPGRGLDELSLGVLGYLAARLCAATGASVRVRAIERERAEMEHALSGMHVLIWPLELELAGTSLGTARALIPEASADAFLRRADATPRSAPPEGALLDLPLTLCTHLGRVVLTRAELDALAPRDVVIPDRSRLARAEDGKYRGQLELHVTGCRPGFSCRLDGSRLTIEQALHCGESTMTDTKRISIPSAAATSELAADAPIELCVELARFTLPLRELSALRPGEVLDTGRAIGASVTLSAAGRPLARGELVDVDGEVGMRVLELLR